MIQYKLAEGSHVLTNNKRKWCLRRLLSRLLTLVWHSLGVSGCQKRVERLPVMLVRLPSFFVYHFINRKRKWGRFGWRFGFQKLYKQLREGLKQKVTSSEGRNLAW